MTGPGITDRWGMACTDLGASVRAADGALVSVFGDTFSGSRVGVGEWRSPVILIGTGDATHEIVYRRAAGGDPRYARQLWRYRHSAGGGLLRRGISTVIPSDLLRVGDDLFLHAIVNRGFGNVVWTEIWRSADNGLTWRTSALQVPGRPAPGPRPVLVVGFRPRRRLDLCGIHRLSAQQGCHPAAGAPAASGAAGPLRRLGSRHAALG